MSLKSLPFLPIKKICKRTSSIYLFHVTYPLALSTVSYMAHSPIADRREEFTKGENLSTATFYKKPYGGTKPFIHINEACVEVAGAFGAWLKEKCFLTWS